MGTSEAAVFSKTADFLSECGYEFLVHVPASHEDTYQSILDTYRQHRVTIGSRYPDILGFTPDGQVVAVEVKGDADGLKGIGQALEYQQGSQRTYIAARETVLNRISDLALSQGIGLIKVPASGNIEIEDPPKTPQGSLSDVRGQLEYRLENRQSVGEIAAMQLSHPLNFLAVPLAIAEAHPQTVEDVHNALRRQDILQESGAAIKGAEILGLIEATQTALTDSGQIAVSVLRGEGITSVAELKATKDRSDGLLHQNQATLAAFLRDRFSHHPEFGHFKQILDSFTAFSVSPLDVTDRLVDRYPNVFLELFCHPDQRERARGLIRSGRADRIHEDPALWRELVRQNVVHNFTRQLMHIGILMPRTSMHSGKLAEYDPTARQWFLESDSEWFSADAD